MRPFSFSLLNQHRRISPSFFSRMENMLTFAHQQQRRNVRWILSLSVLMLLATMISLCAGEQWIAPGDWFSARGDLFVWQIRLPRTLAVLLVGAALALAGAVMQALFENPLAEPGVIGISSGAAVGACTVIVLPMAGGALSRHGTDNLSKHAHLRIFSRRSEQCKKRFHSLTC